MSRLSGGQKAEPMQGGSHPFFRPTVRAMEFNKKNTYGVRILPAYELDESLNPTSPTSWVAYRNPNELDPSSSKPMFTSWYYTFKGYKFRGNAKKGFLSPLTFEATDCRGKDPLYDCYLTARNAGDGHEWHELVEKGEDSKEGFSAVLEKPRVFAAMNAMVELDKNKLENRVVIVTKPSLDHLKEQLNQLTPRGDQPIDPDWEEFVLGDITGPAHGLWGFVKEGSFNDAGMKTMLFQFAQSKDRSIGARQWPIDLNSPWGQEILARRYHIGDLENVTHILTAEEILEFIVNDGFLPPDLVEAACADSWSIPKSKTGRKYSPKVSWEQGTGAKDGVAETPSPTAAAAAAGTNTRAPAGGSFTKPADTPTVKPKENRQFWLLLASNQVAQNMIDEATLARLVEQDKKDHVVCLKGDNQWKPASMFGILIQPPAPAATAPPPPPATGAPPPPSTGMPPAPRGPVASPPPNPPRNPGMPPQAVGTNRPAPVQPPVGQTPPPAGYTPAPPAQSPPTAVNQSPPPPAEAAAAGDGVPSPLTDEEMKELSVLQEEWNLTSSAGKPIDVEKINRFLYLNDRLSGMKSAFKPTAMPPTV